MEMDIRARVDLPYPEIQNADNDLKTVAILKELLSGRDGELTAVLQYMYQSRIANLSEPEIAGVLEEIAIVEMQHAEKLMDAILVFGGNPQYNNPYRQYFSASYINYSQKLKDMLRANIESERDAIEHYSKAIKNVKNTSLQDLFNRIILDEQIHLEVFEKLLNSVKFLSI